MPARAAAAAGATLLGAVYWATSATGVTGGDSGELSISAWHWSVAHPPGYPLYTLVGWLWLWPAKLAGLEPAAWLAKLSVIAGAAAGYQLAMAVANGRRGAHAAMQGLAALTIFGLGAVWWSQCVVVEVYPLAQLLVVISYRVWCSSRRQPREAVPVQQRHLAGLALLASLGLGAHFALTIFAGVLGLSVWVRSREV
ncbi:MAG: DUF2723 domain-containing protein, partial [Proteobacteria bacterium]|nr:DUF2723 domain-containing protein [Pseudomonadota bacterium]